jgi:hypothetical protein
MRTRGGSIIRAAKGPEWIGAAPFAAQYVGKALDDHVGKL